jgi:hypothetical protein
MGLHITKLAQKIKLAQKVRLAVLCTVLLSSGSVLACESSQPSSVVVQKSSEICSKLSGALDGITEQFLSLFRQAEDDEKRQKDHYWEKWAFNTENTPIISGKVDKNVVGLALWMPEDIDEAALSYDEWLESQGFQVSFAVGDKGKEPRVRFDYRWHDAHTPDVMFQVEVPF